MILTDDELNTIANRIFKKAFLDEFLEKTSEDWCQKKSIADLIEKSLNHKRNRHKWQIVNGWRAGFELGLQVGTIGTLKAFKEKKLND